MNLPQQWTKSLSVLPWRRRSSYIKRSVSFLKLKEGFIFDTVLLPRRNELWHDDDDHVVSSVICVNTWETKWVALYRRIRWLTSISWQIWRLGSVGGGGGLTLLTHIWAPATRGGVRRTSSGMCYFIKSTPDWEPAPQTNIPLTPCQHKQCTWISEESLCSAGSLKLMSASNSPASSCFNLHINDALVFAGF